MNSVRSLTMNRGVVPSQAAAQELLIPSGFHALKLRAGCWSRRSTLKLDRAPGGPESKASGIENKETWITGFSFSAASAEISRGAHENDEQAHSDPFNGSELKPIEVGLWVGSIAVESKVYFGEGLRCSVTVKKSSSHNLRCAFLNIYAYIHGQPLLCK